MKAYRYVAMAAVLAFALSCNKEKPTPGPDPEPVPTPANFKSATVLPTDKMMFNTLGGSPDGHYVVGTDFNSSDATVWNLKDNTFSVVSSLPNGGDPFYVNNNGVVVGQAMLDMDNNGQYAFYAANGVGKFLYRDLSTIEYEDVFNPGETYTVLKEGGSSAYSVNADGNLIAGFWVEGFYSHACIWKAPFTGKADRIDLPEPTSEQCGFEVNGTEARWMSEDGSVIVGFLMDDASSWPLIIWTRQADGSYKLEVTCLAYYHPYDWESDAKLAQYMTFAPGCLSPNGKYVGLTLQEYSAEWGAPSKTARLNLQTKELEILAGDYFLPNAISNDGTVVGAVPFGGGVGPLSTKADDETGSYIWRGGEKNAVSLASMVGTSALGSLVDYSLVYISADNSVAAGQGMTQGYERTGFLVK